MPVNVIGTLKPKNNGKFPVAEAVDIKIKDNLRLDKALENLNNFVTPEMYGAVGDGETDDSDAFQAAIDSGYKVAISNKRYLIQKTLTVPAHTVIEGTSRNESIIVCDVNIALNVEETTVFKNLYFQGIGNNICIQGSGYRINIENCYFNEFEVALDVQSLMLAAIKQTYFRRLNKGISIKTTSTACLFESVICTYSNSFLSCDKTGVLAVESYNFVSCCFEGLDEDYTQINIIASDSTHRVSLKNINFESCYFESNGRIFNVVQFVNANFSNCWFFYMVGAGQNEHYLDIENVSPRTSEITLSNCYTATSGNYRELIVPTSKVRYYINNCFIDDRNMLDEMSDKIAFTNVKSYLMYEQNADIASGESVQINTDFIFNNKISSGLVLMQGGQNSSHWQFVGYINNTYNDFVVIPIVSKNCSLTTIERNIIYTNESPTHTQSAEYPFKLIFVEL